MTALRYWLLCITRDWVFLRAKGFHVTHKNGRNNPNEQFFRLWTWISYAHVTWRRRLHDHKPNLLKSTSINCWARGVNFRVAKYKPKHIHFIADVSIVLQWILMVNCSCRLPVWSSFCVPRMQTIWRGPLYRWTERWRYSDTETL